MPDKDFELKFSQFMGKADEFIQSQKIINAKLERNDTTLFERLEALPCPAMRQRVTALENSSSGRLGKLWDLFKIALVALVGWVTGKFS